MQKHLFVILPAFPTQRIIQCLGKRRAEFVDRVVKAELRIHFDAPLHCFRKCVEEFPVVCARKIQIRRVIVSILTGGEIQGMLAAAGVRPRFIYAASPFTQERAHEILRRMLKGRQRKDDFGMRGKPIL